MKTVLMIISIAVLVCWPMAAGAQTNEELETEIEQLKKQIQPLEEKIGGSEQTQSSADQVEKLEKRVAKVEAKAAKDKIDWGAEMRFRLDSQDWHINPYQQFMGQETPPVAVPAQGWDNTAQYSIRLRLRMNADISDDLKFTGRLSMYKLYGGSDVPIFNGFPNAVLDSFNGSRIPSNEVLRVERALLKWNIPHKPLAVSFGCMNSSDGPPLELREGSKRQGTPMAMMVNAEQYVTATNNLGNMDQFGITWQHNINDVFHLHWDLNTITDLPAGSTTT